MDNVEDTSDYLQPNQGLQSTQFPDNDQRLLSEAQKGGGIINVSSVSYTLIGIIVWIVAGVFAAYFSYKCSRAAHEDKGMTLVYTFIAFLFSIPYLIWYFIVRVFFGNECKHCGSSAESMCPAKLPVK
jgi:hypothetical protein